MKNLLSQILIASTATMLISCSSVSKKETAINGPVCNKLTEEQAPKLIWSTSGFEGPESVFLYDERTKNFKPYYLVSNVAGVPNEKDGKGWISKVSMSGKIEAYKFAQGLNAPKGIYAGKGLMFVSDIDRVVCFDLNNGKKACDVQIPGAKFLNDVHHIYGGSVVVSDTVTNQLSLVENGKASSWLQDSALEAPNGLTLVGKNNALLVASWGPGMKDDFSTTALGRVLEIESQTRKITTWSETRLGNLDGIAADGPDAVLVSDWMAGKVYRLKKNGECTLLLEGLKGAADFSFHPQTRTLTIPLMQENKVNAYSLPIYK